jgi:hypothetical protein
MVPLYFFVALKRVQGGEARVIADAGPFCDLGVKAE